MTTGAGGVRPGVPALWALPLGILAGISTAALAGVASRAVLLDFIAWWPVWLVFMGLAIYARGRYLGVVRASGLVPLLGTVAAVIFLVGHLQGWPLMPSSSGRLIGPEPSYDRASLDATVEGELRVSGRAAFLYELFPVRWGGPVGIPDAVERSAEGSIMVTLQAPARSGFQSYRGWVLRLSSAVPWELELGGTMTVDLTDVQLIRAALSGSGHVDLGVAPGATEVALQGQFVLSVPSDAPVRVVGEADVPAGWERLGDGWLAPAEGAGWLITVSEDSRVAITGRD